MTNEETKPYVGDPTLFPTDPAPSGDPNPWSNGEGDPSEWGPGTHASEAPVSTNTEELR
ncbi:MAG: hypothetical protein ABUL60_29520 [Myxococcales bacterium]